MDEHGPISLVIRDTNIWTRNGLIRGSILIEHGRIKRIARRFSSEPDEQLDGRGLLALPGLVDAHVHLRDMKLSYKEDFTSGTSAAAAGGFTTVLDMPNTQPPTDSAKRLRLKAARAARKILVNVGFHTAAVESPAQALSMKSAGSFSMKLYLPNPISPLNADDDHALSKVLMAAERASLPLTVHAEDPAQFQDPGATDNFKQMAFSRTHKAESQAINRILRLRKKSVCRVHFCHVTLPTSVDAIHKSRQRGTSSEVTPHHVLLDRDSLRRLGWKAWMVPPLRSRPERNRLFRDMAAGRATIIATDHAPHTIKEKNRSPLTSRPGVPGLETALPLMLTMVNKGRLSLGRLVSLLATSPARIFGLRAKGRLEAGADGDLVLVDMRKRSKVDPGKFLSKAHYSPFEGWRTNGGVYATIVNGHIVYRDDQIVAKPGTGTVLKN